MEDNKEVLTKKILTRVCKKCNIEKELTCFNINKNCLLGREPKCKTCRKNTDNLRKLKYQQNPINKPETKVCFACKVEQLIEEFPNDKSKKDGLNPSCRTCKSNRDKKYKEKNDEEIKAYNKVWAKEYRDNNIERRVYHNINTRMNKILKNHYTKHPIFYIGCKVIDLLKWLEYQFIDGMSWDNYGDNEDNWHIDHVKPCFSFDLNDKKQVYECFNWRNLQPLWKKDNIIKGHFEDNLLIENHKLKIEGFKKNYDIQDIIEENIPVTNKYQLKEYVFKNLLH